MPESDVRPLPRAVLWDADGVLQSGPERVPRLLSAGLPAGVGEALAEDLWTSAWDDAVAGRWDMVEHVEATIRAHGLDDHREVLLATWEQVETLPDSLEVLARVRAQVPCYLATNQDTLRMRTMQQMGYDELADGVFYSCAVGAAKPDPVFFERVADALGEDPGDLLFVDDMAENVAAARAVGLHAEQWHFTDGVEALRVTLAEHGIRA
ncbi:haloacid dehalogenase [Marmoricola endophyticus]|uniref:Haloacid dehalogenase n=1 Tax=Marmoricola endophyticus TaxID=2040280 RepID=A0A917BN71_9ACTN|nr:HAD family phosphatase [Marmoricola endophyticus]GGF52701.1 haloacid dehalogenase [Marmoricola endophyticus]